MKTNLLPMAGLTLERLLEKADEGEVVFLTEEGHVRYALVRAEDGDKEILAMRSNRELMDYLSECSERAKTRPRKSLQEMRRLDGHSE
jgi:hypothetical protein